MQHRKTYGRICAVVLFYFFFMGSLGSSCVGSDRRDVSSENQKKYHVPREVEYYKGRIHKKGGLINKLYPIGWSADGKMAYVVEPADEACGCYFFSFVIQDMKKNTIVWSWEKTITYSTDDSVEAFPVGKELAHVWEENHALFEDQLKIHHITQNNGFEIFKPSIENKGQTYHITLETERSDESGFDVVTSARVFVTSKTRSAPIFEKTYEFSEVLRAELVGYFKCPYDDVIAIIYLEENRGYEGPPNVVGFRLVGYGLSSEGGRP